jgi:hypothetical protein
LAALVFGTANCADRDPQGGTPDGGGGTPESVPDGVSRDDADSGVCCPIDPTPGCCMSYGGTRPSWGCGVVCDGMAWPNDPRWEKRTDENGCARWVDPPFDPESGVCGGIRPEAGVDAPKDTQPDTDAPVGADVHHDSDAGLCCPIDPTPGCCMNYGGTRLSWGCGVVCDGMAWPNDPRWEKRTDENGCDYWVDPPFDPARGVCGGIRPEAGVDAPRDTQPDTDAP